MALYRDQGEISNKTKDVFGTAFNMLFFDCTKSWWI